MQIAHHLAPPETVQNNITILTFILQIYTRTSICGEYTFYDITRYIL